LSEKEPFLDALANRILLLDGAMGTEIQKFDPNQKIFLKTKMDSMTV